VHSFFINRKKRHSWHFVRASTDISAVAALFGAVMVLMCRESPNVVKTAICWDFLYNGFSVATVQLCDNYMFFNRFKAVQEVPNWKAYLMQSYVWIVMTLTWLPAYTLLPYFYDTNSGAFGRINSLFLYVQGYGGVLYNFYFTYEFTLFLYRGASGHSSRYLRHKRIAVKSIIHCFTSSIGTLLSGYYVVEGALILIIIIPVGLHLLFNIRIEELLTPTRIQTLFRAQKSDHNANFDEQEVIIEPILKISTKKPTFKKALDVFQKIADRTLQRKGVATHCETPKWKPPKP